MIFKARGHRMSSGTVLAILGQNENQALHAGSEWIGRELERRGYQHRIIDMYNPGGGEKLMTLLHSGEIYFVYGYAGVGSQFTLTNGQNLWTASRTPFLSLWHDHPAYNYRQHIVDSPYVIHGYHVQDHLEVRQKFLPSGVSHAFLLPTCFDVADQQFRNSFRNRTSEIYYAKTGKDPQVYVKDWERHSSQIQAVLWQLVELARNDRNLDVVVQTADLFRNLGQSINDLDLFMGIVAEVDGYIRSWRSDHLARALLAHPAHIFGRGWDYLKSSNKVRAEFYPPISSHEFIMRMRQYRINANSNPLWRDGVHERVSLGFHFGCINLTDRTVKSDSILSGLPNYMAFEWGDDLQDVIADTIRRSAFDDIDYVEIAGKVFNEKNLAKTSDYVSAIERAVATMKASI